MNVTHSHSQTIVFNISFPISSEQNNVKPDTGYKDRVATILQKAQCGLSLQEMGRPQAQFTTAIYLFLLQNLGPWVGMVPEPLPVQLHALVAAAAHEHAREERNVIRREVGLEQQQISSMIWE